MSLLLPVYFKGLTAALWKIEEVSYSKKTNTVSCLICLYANATAKQSGVYLNDARYTFDASDYEFNQDLIKYCYLKLKTTEDFLNAKDL